MAGRTLLSVAWKSNTAAIQTRFVGSFSRGLRNNLKSKASICTRELSQKAITTEIVNFSKTKKVLGLAVASGAIIGYTLCNNDVDCSDKSPNQERFARFWPRKIVILFGKPGAGKGTQGPKVQALLDLPVLSTGDMLREAVHKQTEVGKKAQDLMAAGKFVPDDIVIGIVRERIMKDDCRFGFILDGFPRTRAQAEALRSMLAEHGERVSEVIELSVPNEVLVDRVVGRWVHRPSGRSYHYKFNPPTSYTKYLENFKDGSEAPVPTPENMLDDVTGEKLMRRADDNAEALVSRLEAYSKLTEPILDFYAPEGIVQRIKANQSMDKVWRDLRNALSRRYLVEDENGEFTHIFRDEEIKAQTAAGELTFPKSETQIATPIGKPEARPGDAEKGAKVFARRCAQCHTMHKGEAHKEGPNLFGLYGRKPQSIEGYEYSEAAKNKATIWTEDTMLAYLEDPKAFVPGTTMHFSGIKSQAERSDLLAYLRKATQE
eukprot:m.339054 g.339054  ORF g.339054 m.339054 type:complete len:489 (-) comp18645_c0_seq1:82-1548(-)